MNIGTQLIVLGSVGMASLLLGFYGGIQHGRQQQLADSVVAYQKSEKIHADVGGRDDYRICLDLGGVPEQCDELRGLAKAAGRE